MGHKEDTASTDEILEIVKEVCSKEQIQNLISEANERKGHNVKLRTTGNIDPVLLGELRNAVQLNMLSRNELYSAIGDSEESGKQHIFFYRPVNVDVAYAMNDAEAVGARLFGSGWRSTSGFPRYFLPDSTSIWADFRIIPTAISSVSGWVLKMYTGKWKEKHIGDRDEGNNRFARIYKKYLSREVFVVRWNPHGVLEMRVPLEKKVRELMASLAGLWNSVEPAFRKTEFKDIDLIPVCKSLIDHHERDVSIYNLTDLHFLVTEGSARFSVRKLSGNAMAEEAFKSAISLFDRCKLLSVLWLLDEKAHATQDNLRSVIGKIRPNEMMVLSRTNSKVIDHVANQLRRHQG